MMKRIVATLFFLFLILIAVAVVAPGFIDWSQHKDRLIAQLKPYLGRQIDVGGQVSFRLVPNPRLLLEDVTLSNAEGAKADHFMKLKQLEANMKLEPLLQGRFEVETINLDQPELDLEVLDDGSNNWTGILKERQEGGTGLEDAADTIQFNQITMTNGTLHYLNQVTGATWQVANLNLAVSADTLFGPYHVSGDMQYKGTTVSVEASTGKFGGAAVPLHVAFNPAEKLPQVKLDGTMDTQGGLSLQGDLSIAQGNIASLFDSDFLKGISFLNEDTDLTAALDVKAGTAKLDNIKAKYGKKGELSGSLAVAFEKDKKPVVAADLTGTSLKVTGKSTFMQVPDGFDAHLKLKGKNITWNGIFVPAATVAVDSDKEDWVVKGGRFDMPGKSVVKVAGVLTPKTKYAAYSLQVNSEDVPELLKALPLGEGNILKMVQTSQVIKAVDWSSSLDLRPNQASFSDIDGKINGKVKVSGVLDVALDDKAPSFKANLNFDDADLSVVADDAWKAFTAGVLKSSGDIEVAAKNFSDGDVKLSALSLNAKTGAAGAQVKDLSGVFTDGGEFALNGAVASLNPAAGLDIVYRVKTQNPGAVAKALGINLPPPMRAESTVDIHGHVGGDAAKYSFNAEGHGLSLNGTQETNAEGTESYQETLHLEKPDNGGVFATLGLPIDGLVGAPKSLDAELSGTRAHYKVGKIDAGGVTGSIERKDAKFEGDLAAATLDMDEWMSGSWAVKDAFNLKLKGKKLAWRADEIVGPELTLAASADSLHVQGLTGQIWGGDLTADAEGHRKDDAWSGTLKGSIKGAELGKLAALMEFKGFSVGPGDLDFDLTSDSGKEKAQWFHGVEGTLNVKASELTVRAFAPAALPELIASLKKPSDDLAQDVVRALMSGDTRYSDVDGAFKIADGKINIEKLVLADDSAKVDLKGAFDMGPETYRITGDLRLKSAPEMPPLSLNRSGEMKGAPDYGVNIRPLQDYLAKRMAKDETPVTPAPAETPSAPEAAPDSKRVLLKHEGDATSPPPDAVPEPAPAPPLSPSPSPDQSSAPVPLTAPPAEAPPPTDATDVGPPAQPPALPTPPETDGNGGRIDEPIETEPLAAPPAPPPVHAPLPEQAAPSPSPAPVPEKGDHAAIKGILDRLDDGSDPKPATSTQQDKSAAPDAPPSADDEPVKP